VERERNVRGSRPPHRAWLLAAIFGLSLLVAGSAGAAAPYNYSVGVFGGLGGALDAEDSDLDHGSFQLMGSLFTEPRTLLVARLGRIGFDEESRIGGLTSADLTYLTVAGEYRFSESLYDSGLFLGLGAYRLEGDLPGAVAEEDTAIGATFGVTGDFRMTRWLSFQLELAGHWADLAGDQIFALGHAGLVVHF